MIAERKIWTASGYFMMAALLVVLVLAVVWLIASVRSVSPLETVLAALTIALDIFFLAGLFSVNPNEARVIQLFGRYLGTTSQPGLRYVTPFCTNKRISLRVRNFESGILKVNDRDGNPIEIAAVVVWRVVDTAEAVFEVDDYTNFVHIQSEAALRGLTTSYRYDTFEHEEFALRSHVNEIADKLKHEIQERLSKAGVQVIEARISHLAYAPEIAGAMLQRQQATAIIAARQKIVEGAVGMVEMALDHLSQRNVVALDDERKAAMVSNLLVVLCSDRHTQPVVNTGSLYH
ncbi:MAG: SPFH domain-containing protein [Candidatus Eisenbacteria bacterium]|nr:SPFH domain-containing protein [Candidatus Eisenbacteria bacterium]